MALILIPYRTQNTVPSYMGGHKAMYGPAGTSCFSCIPGTEKKLLPGPNENSRIPVNNEPPWRAKPPWGYRSDRGH